MLFPRMMEIGQIPFPDLSLWRMRTAHGLISLQQYMCVCISADKTVDHSSWVAGYFHIRDFIS